MFIKMTFIYTNQNFNKYSLIKFRKRFTQNFQNSELPIHLNSFVMLGRISLFIIIQLVSLMQVGSLHNFIDIAQFTLHGQEEYITIQILPNRKLSKDSYDELSVVDVEVTGNLLTPCFYFIEECDESQSMSVLALDYEEELEDMVIQELEEENISEEEDYSQEEESFPEKSTIGFDLLDVLERQYEKLRERQVQENSKHQLLSSSTSVSGDRATQKGEDFEGERMEENPGYALETRRDKVERYLHKRKNRNWNKKISYKCRKEVADSRLRVKGRFVTRQQANKLLGINTVGMSVDLVRTLLESKFGREKDLEIEDMK